MLEALEQRVHRRLADLDAAGALRSLRPPSGIDLSSNDYLGLARHELIVERMVEAARREGCGSTGSRLLRGERPAFAEVERRFARFKGAAAALYFGTGYSANLGALTTFLDPGDVVFSDELNHASLIDGLRLSRARRVVYAHCNVDALYKLIKNENSSGQKFLVTESIFSMDGDRAPLADYAAICRDAGVALIVDEAHAVGIFGARGSGLIEETGVDAEVFLSVNTAGKALGVCGAFVTASAWAIDYLIQRARTFIFSTAPPPAIAAALDAALTVIAEEPERRQRLKDLVAYAHDQLCEKGLTVPGSGSQIIPVIIGGNAQAVAVASSLQAAGFDVRAIRPPTVPEGTARLRISLNANLDRTTLSSFAAAAATALDREGLMRPRCEASALTVQP
jgi:8-amino-7-oxononanoate synthase